MRTGKRLEKAQETLLKKTDASRLMPSRESMLLSPEMRGGIEGGENNKFLCGRRVKAA